MRTQETEFVGMGTRKFLREKMCWEDLAAALRLVVESAWRSSPLPEIQGATVIARFGQESDFPPIGEGKILIAWDDVEAFPLEWFLVTKLVGEGCTNGC